MYGHQCPLLQPRPHSIGVNLAKILVGLELEHLGKPRTAKGCVGLGTEGDWIGVGYRLERGMKNVRYDKKAELSEICKYTVSQLVTPKFM